MNLTRPSIGRLPGYGLLSCLLILALLVSPVRGSDASEHQDYMNGGYYLLHQVCADESKLSVLFTVKDAPVEIEHFADRISKTADQSLDSLDRMRKNDPRIRFDKNPLPEVERDVRDSIKGEKQHQLLFGTSGPPFVQALLVSQIEASHYAHNLAKILADEEKDPDRAKALRNISAKWQAIGDECYRLLLNSSVSSK